MTEPTSAQDLVQWLRMNQISIRLNDGGQTFTVRPKKKVPLNIAEALASQRAAVIAILQAERGITRDSDDHRPPIDAGIGDLQRLGDETWKVLIAANVPPQIFRRSGLVCVGLDDDGRPVIQALGEASLAHYLAKIAHFYVERQRGDTVVRVDTPPPARVVRDLLAHPQPPVPVLTRIVETPFFDSEGRLHDAPGYSATSRTIYVPPPGFLVPDVPRRPTVTDITHARNLLLQVVDDFPFVSDADRAHVLALALAPFVRDLISGPVPLIIIDKPSPGTGASLLVKALSYIVTGGAAPNMTEATTEEEWRKRLTAVLAGGPASVVLDNVRYRLDSAALSSVLTCDVFEDRVLGHSKMVRLPVRCSWAVTGNNVTTSLEIARRSVRVRLDAAVERPWLRKPQEFTHPDLLAWIAARRPALVHASLVMCQAWVAAGRPLGHKSLGMYERWAEVMGGIIHAAGVPGFLDNLDAMYEVIDAESEETRRFLHAWWGKFGDAVVLASDLYAVATDPEVAFPLNGKDEATRRVSLGRRLASLRHRPYEIEPGLTVRITKADKPDREARAARWGLTDKPGPQERGVRGRERSSHPGEGSDQHSEQRETPKSHQNAPEDLSDLSDLSGPVYKTVDPERAEGIAETLEPLF